MEIVEQIMRDIIEIGLFSQSEGHIFCFKLLKRMSLSMTSNPSFRSAISKKKEEYHDDIMTNHDFITTGHERLKGLTVLKGLKKDTNTSEVSIPEEAEKPKSKEMEQAEALAELLLTESRKNDEKFRIGKDAETIKSWSKDIEKLIRIDKREPEEIKNVIVWCKSDSFWSSNILSGSKLRDKFPALLARMSSGRKETRYQGRKLNGGAGNSMSVDDYNDIGK